MYCATCFNNVISPPILLVIGTLFAKFGTYLHLYNVARIKLNQYLSLHD